jgi:hypothetical protein
MSIYPKDAFCVVDKIKECVTGLLDEKVTAEKYTWLVKGFT